MGWVEGRVCGLRRWNEHLFSLQIEAAIEPFKAGQYNRLRLFVNGDWVSRPYSYVNAPGDTPLEFHFVRVESGSLSGLLAQRVPGDVIELMPRSSGLFTLDAVPAAPSLWLLATGTGIGPYLSMLSTPEPWSRFRDIRLVHCVREASDLSYRDRIDAVAATYSTRFRYLPLATRETVDGTLGLRIPQALECGILEDRAELELDPGRSQVMLCGNPEMVRDMLAKLRERGFRRNRRDDPGQVTIENYW